MASLGGTFDANNVEPAAPIEVLPPGKYLVQIIKSEMKETKAGNGQMLALEFDILDGPAKGRRLWDNLNLVNPNVQAQEIAQRTLSAICHAVGKLQVSDSDELHFKPMLATVTTIPEGTVEKNGFVHKRGKNEIAGYEASSAGASRSHAAPAFQQPSQAHVAAPAMAAPRPAMANAPWRRSA